MGQCRFCKFCGAAIGIGGHSEFCPASNVKPGEHKFFQDNTGAYYCIECNFHTISYIVAQEHHKFMDQMPTVKGLRGFEFMSIIGGGGYWRCEQCGVHCRTPRDAMDHGQMHLQGPPKSTPVPTFSFEGTDDLEKEMSASITTIDRMLDEDYRDYIL